MNGEADPVWFVANHIPKLGFSLEFQTDILAAIVLLLALQLYRPRAHVVWGLGQSSVFQLSSPGQPPIKILTRTLFVANWGFSVAQDVEVRLSDKPANYQLSPPIEHQLQEHEDGSCTLLAPSLGPQDHMVIEFLQLNGRIPNVVSVRSFDGQSKAVDMAPARRFSPPLRYGLAVLLVLGAFYALKLVFSLIVLAAR